MLQFKLSWTPILVPFSLFLSVAGYSADMDQVLKSPEMRVAIFDSLSSEITRLDAEGLIVRSNRASTWNAVLDRLRGEVREASDWTHFGASFYRLDQAYPNLHAMVEFNPAIEEQFAKSRVPAVRFWTDWLTLESTQFRILSVDSRTSFPADLAPQKGDVLLAINGRPMEAWSVDNFEFCKQPLRHACDTDLWSNFIGRILPVDQTAPLVYRLQRGERIWEIEVPVLEALPRPPRDYSYLQCRSDLERYSGFHAIYVGNRACVFESDTDPKVAILRITSFAYRRISDDEPIRSVTGEVRALYPWWKEHANWSHLIIDLADNGGGNEPIPYYQLLFTEPFQEQYFRLKKLPELSDPKIREGVFWESEGKEIWFQRLASDETLDKIPEGELLPLVPMFCADEDKACDEGLYEPKEHPFKGRVSVILNEWCVSSCDGFAYEIADSLGERARFFGHPQAADTAYSRLTIHVILDDQAPQGFRTVIGPIRDDELVAKSLVSQTVSVSQSFTKDGVSVSGVPLPLNGFIPETLENRNEWVDLAVEAALK